MDKIDEIKERILEDVKPPEKEIKETWGLFEDISDYISQKFGLKADLMGSVAKKTFLKGNKDLDIFVFFPETKDADKLEDKGLKIGKSVFEHFGGDYEVDYAEHPYTKGEIRGFDVEIVPCYKLDKAENLKSSVDRTPFHTKWINENLSEEEKKEVIILKDFLQERKLYGSSLKIEGFSGYLCELLIAEYGSFEEVLEASQEWNHKEKLDPQEHWKEEEINIPDKVWKRFKNDCFIMIDPVDPERNVASVLSEEKYAKFIYEVWRFLEKPSMDFFQPEDIKVEEKRLKKALDSHGKILALEFENPGLIDDVLYPQLRRTLKRLKNELTKNEFELFETGIYVEKNKISLMFDFKVEELPKARKQLGPQIYHNQEHLNQFREKYEKVWVEDSRLVTIVERQFRKPEPLLEQFITGSVEELKKRGIPENIAKVMKGFDIKKVEKVKGNKEWIAFLAEFLKP